MLIYCCDELFKHQDVKGGFRRIKDPNEVDLLKFEQLHSEGKRLINGWFRRGWRIWENDSDKVFESFIFNWFAFNSWAACITDKDDDTDIMDSLAADRGINEKFNSLLKQPEAATGKYAKQFYTFIPIFDAKTLNNQRLLYSGDETNRAERVNYYFNNVTYQEAKKPFDPKCSKRHLDSGEVIPMDWAHLLKAIYKVRCNLFHGQKTAQSEMNRQIVSAAFLMLANFLHEGGYLKKPVTNNENK